MPKTYRFLPWLLLGLFILLLLGLWVGGYLWIRGFLRSDDFRRLVEAKTGEAVGGEATYNPLHWAGDSVFSDALTVDGAEGSPVKKFQADQLRAEVNWRAIFDGAWRINDLSVTYFEGTFGPQSAATPPPEAEPVATPAGLRRFLPQRFEIGAVAINQARLTFVDLKGAEMATIRDCTLNLRPEGTGWVIDGHRGFLGAGGLPSFNIDSFRSRMQKDSFFLTDAQLRLGETGKITASGEFSASSNLHVTWKQVDIDPFLSSEWKGKITGKMAGTSTITLSGGDATKSTASGHFELSDGMVQHVAMLEQIADFTGLPEFRMLPLQQFSGDYTCANGQLILTNLVAESQGNLRLEGTCSMSADGKIDGALRLGVTSRALKWLPGSRERVFNVEENGYLWTDVHVSGTLQNMQEDLSARLINSMKNELIQQGKQLLDNLPGPAGDAAKKAVDTLTPLIP